MHAGSHALRVTTEHPIAVAPGVFTVAGNLSAGQAIEVWDDHDLHQVAIDHIERVRESVNVYNLMVLPGGTFIAGGVVVHNKGCFLPDTPVELANGHSKRIDQVRPGDTLLAFTPEGHVLTTTVRRVLTAQVDSYLKVQTDSRLLRVTPEHPFYVGHGTFQTIGSLHVGDAIYVLHDGTLSPEHINGMEKIAGPVTVYNLQTDDPGILFCHGVKPFA